MKNQLSCSARGQPPVRTSRGTSLVETMVTLGLMGTILGMAVVNFREQLQTKKTVSEELLSAIQGIRWRAMATTSTYLVKPSSAQTLSAYPGTSCSSPVATEDLAARYKLSKGSFVSTNWTFCFRSDGRTDSNLVITVLDTDGTTHSIEVLLGGGAREIQL